MSNRFTNSDASLADVKAWIQERLEQGVWCPACHQHAKIYKRRLNAAVCYVLNLLYKAHKASGVLDPARAEFVHVPSLITEKSADNPRRAAAVRGDAAKLKHWGLIEEQPGKRGDGSKRVGYYRITPRGIAFVQGQITVPSYVWIYNETVIDRAVTERTSFEEALSKKFNYAELMSNV